MSTSTNFPIGAQGASIPAIGFGTFQPDVNPAAGVTEAVLRALEAGYRHIDTAWMYGNGEAERGVGEALRRWKGKREEVFIVTKLANAHHKPADVAAAMELSLKNLGLEYVDLYLMHTPVAYERIGKGEDEWLTVRLPGGKPKLDMALTQRYDQTWKAMEGLVRAGKAKHIGLSNFSIQKMRKILKTCTIKPAVNQVEIHPYLIENDLINFYIPGPLQNGVIKSIAEKHGITPAQVLLKWGLQRGTSVIPKAYKPSHIAENFATLALPNLSNEDCTTIDQIRKNEGEVRFINYLSHWGFDIYRPGPEDPTEEPEVVLRQN
ncbi:hypothetical protein V2A60_009114 [Cordyceps javanica]